MKLKDYHLPLRRQEESWTCGFYATSFAIEAKANMRKISNNECRTDLLIDIWQERFPGSQGFMLPLRKSLEVFPGKMLVCDDGTEIEMYNIHTLEEINFKNICKLVDNLVTPVIAITFKGRRFRDDYIAYTSNSNSNRSRNHIVAVIGYTDNYLILKDSAGSNKRPDGSYNRIYKDDISIVRDCCYFNVKKYTKKIMYPILDVYPVSQWFGENPQIYSQFGMNGHNGCDIATPIGTEVLSPINGTVKIKDDKNKGYGLHIRIRNNEHEVIVAHLSRVAVRESEEVIQGNVIGYTGSSGFSTGPHLHWGVRHLKDENVLNYSNGYKGYVDPMKLLM